MCIGSGINVNIKFKTNYVLMHEVFTQGNGHVHDNKYKLTSTIKCT